MSIFKFVASAGLLASLVLGGAVADFTLNDGRVLYAAMGRDALIATCQPLLVKKLTERGFEPNDIDFGPRPDIAFASGRGKSFGDSFTFTDGPGGERVDGVAACVIAGREVRVDVRVRTTPRRAA